MNKKINIYQVFTRLFGNTETANIPWGTMEQNGCGKFSDFTDRALSEIQALGISHIWYTGVPHHALVRDYKSYQITDDHPAVVKGRAGSPYAVKDYYQVNPDLADDPANRLAEFEALIERTHNSGMKVIIDIVPNHVARSYLGMKNPEGVNDFGADDNTDVEYHHDNNFYYIPNQAFELPEIPELFKPLGGEAHSALKTPFVEYPAKWTGNGSRLSKPDADDWYETVKVNYGVRPDGTKDFPELPEEYRHLSYQNHFEFWQQHNVPNSWVKFRDIALYWLDKGVDGFRYDMAEMVPVEFWSYLNASIKNVNPDAFLMAEVYQPDFYRDYIQLGLMDALYDKVDFYDGLKEVIQGKASTKVIGEIQSRVLDIDQNMLHFLDNHDEQRLASPEFAGDMDKGRPAMLVSALLSRSPTMIYFGQEVGEPGKEQAGFGQPSRTSIFDYIGVPEHQKWMNGGRFDGGGLSDQQRYLRNFYKRLLNFAPNSHAMLGAYVDLYVSNEKQLGDRCHLFARYSEKQLVLGVSNFSAIDKADLDLIVPKEIIESLNLADGRYMMMDEVGLNHPTSLHIAEGIGRLKVTLKPLGASAYTLSL